MDKSRSDKSRKIQFCNVSSVWGLLVKSYSLVALINPSLTLSTLRIVTDKGSFSHDQAYIKKR